MKSRAFRISPVVHVVDGEAPRARFPSTRYADLAAELDGAGGATLFGILNDPSLTVRNRSYDRKPLVVSTRLALILRTIVR